MTQQTNPMLKMSKCISTKLEGPITHLEKIISTITEKDPDQIVIQAMIKRVEEVADGVYSSIADIKDTIKILTPAVNSLQTKIKDLMTKTLSNPTSQTMASWQSCSAITATNLPPMVDQVLARAAAHERQIILDSTPGNQIFPPNTPCSDITEKISAVLAFIK
ncbi:uncharacterized protein BJ212DRAFT_1303681 [Suillus subaureus]|uniref:Uncharacterized protein n=1 Tax=Suillus subaureus TaxID=48587 RepID=A0A9P7DZI9_9AGAM|nr:uncharacterized protein BJ212DRAFT_1303681 [Suillus subaureus]KAG1807040.1 hypothetical protein BJ212DRAFT_1303681 [Suillus subaureus]